VDFLHYVTSINCLTGAIISETTNKYIYITKYDPPHQILYFDTGRGEGELNLREG
jgi:hypothetical protein